MNAGAVCLESSGLVNSAVETVADFIFLCSKVIAEGDCRHACPLEEKLQQT